MARISNEVLHERLNHLIDNVEDIHKTLHGNGRPGLVDQFNQWKGAMKVTHFLLSSGVVASIVVSFTI